MGRPGRLLLGLGALAGAFGVASVAGAHWGPYRAQLLGVLSENRAFRVCALAGCAVALVGCAAQLLRALFSRDPERAFARVDAEGTIEITCRAVESAAKAAVEATGLALADRVELRGRGRGIGSAVLSIEAVPLVESDLKGAGEVLRAEASRACEALVGAPAGTVRIKFLRAKTVTTVDAPRDERKG